MQTQNFTTSKSVHVTATKVTLWVQVRCVCVCIHARVPTRTCGGDENRQKIDSLIIVHFNCNQIRKKKNSFLSHRFA